MDFNCAVFELLSLKERTVNPELVGQWAPCIVLGSPCLRTNPGVAKYGHAGVPSSAEAALMAWLTQLATHIGFVLKAGGCAAVMIYRVAMEQPHDLHASDPDLAHVKSSLQRS